MAEQIENRDDLIEPGEGIGPEDTHGLPMEGPTDNLDLLSDADDAAPEPAAPAEGEPEPKETPQTPAISEAALRVAEAAGLSREQALQFANESDVLYAAEIMMRQRGPAQAGAAPQAPTPGQAGPQQQAGPPAEPQFKVELPEDFDPELAEPLNKALQQVAEHYQKQIQQLQQTLGTFAYQQQQQYIDRFNAEVQKLGSDFEDIFGSDAFEDMTPSDPHYQNWLRVDEEMRKEAAMLAQQGRTLSQSRLFRNAVARLWPDKFRSRAGGGLAKKLQKRENLMTPRPSGRDTAEQLPPEVRATRAVAQKMRELGLL